MAGKHWVNLELLFMESNRVLRDFIENLGGDVLLSARMDNPAKKTVKIVGRRGTKLNYEAKASGQAAGMLGFDYSFRVPMGGFKPPPGSKAFMMIKPEGPVWRARIYNRLEGQVVRRRGFFSEAMREQILSIKGKRRNQFMNDALAKQVAQAIADNIARDLRLIPGMSALVIP